jgi:hypothetical protein
MELIEQFKNELAAFEAKRKEMAKGLQEKFPSLIAPLFEKHKWVTSISWRQYSPWNDGDETSFEVRVGNDQLTINELDWYDDEGYNNEEKKDVFKEFSELLTSIPEEIMKYVFGDSNEVKVLNTGEIEVTTYED